MGIAIVSQSLDHLFIRLLGMTAGLVWEPNGSQPLKLQSFYTGEQIDDIYAGMRLE